MVLPLVPPVGIVGDIVGGGTSNTGAGCNIGVCVFPLLVGSGCVCVVVLEGVVVSSPQSLKKQLSSKLTKLGLMV